MSRICTKCGGSGPFYKDKKTKDGLTVWCADCMRNYSSQRRKNQPEKVRQSVRAWEKANPQKKAACLRRWKRNNPEKNRATHAVMTQRRRARLAGAPHTLGIRAWRKVLEVFNHCCAYCLRPAKKLTMDHVVAVSRGGGTTEENVVPACLPCNLRKSNHPVFVMVGI